MMQIELWCDIICPWCGLTHHRLQEALKRFEHRDGVKIVYRSFQLHPELDRAGVTQRELVAMYAKNPAAIEEVLRPIEVMAEQEGLHPYRAIERTLGPTDHAHELLAYATDKGLHAHAWDRMFRVHFGEARKLWTINEVVAFAAEIGLDPTEARAVLESRKYRERVESDQRDAQSMGATGTPFMVIDGNNVIPGAQDTAAMLGILRRFWPE